MNETIQEWKDMPDIELITLFNEWLRTKEYGSVPVPLIKRGTILRMRYPEIPASTIYQFEVENMLIEIALRFTGVRGALNENPS